MIALLEANHRFPGEYHLSVIALNADGVFAAIRAAIEAGLVAPLEDATWETRESSKGKYLSHRFRVPVQSAADVLALYERLHGLEGVVTVM
jgi:putative lipoic acid-binding regulatory protein